MGKNCPLRCHNQGFIVLKFEPFMRFLMKISLQKMARHNMENRYHHHYNAFDKLQNRLAF